MKILSLSNFNPDRVGTLLTKKHFTRIRIPQVYEIGLINFIDFTFKCKSLESPCKLSQDLSKGRLTRWSARLLSWGENIIIFQYNVLNIINYQIDTILYIKLSVVNYMHNNDRRI